MHEICSAFIHIFLFRLSLPNSKDATCDGHACRFFCSSVSPSSVSTQIFLDTHFFIQRQISQLTFSRQLDVPSYWYDMQTEAQHTYHTSTFAFTQLYYKFVEIHGGGD